MTNTPVTRFAPSPTGYLHIGGARTALFNWLYAKRQNGKYLLRIEDTDRARSTDAAVQAILDGLEWLGLTPDEAPVYQHTRADRHQEIARQLLDSGQAYRCYATPDELEAMRNLAREEGRPPVYDGTWRDRPESESPDGIGPAIRFKSPQTGETIINDKVQGKVVFDNAQLDDFILLRSDGSPTYMMSVIVDDHDMGVTHIIRGDDHLNNAARQSQVYDALEWKRPVFAHIPLIHGDDGAKLSKRHGALGVEAYRAMGYLPAALRNYLVRLGWSHGDNEFFTEDQLLKWFGFKGMGKSPSRLDFKKLDNMNGHYIKNSEDATLVELIKDSFSQKDLQNPVIIDSLDPVLVKRIQAVYDQVGRLSEAEWDKLLAAMPGLKTRGKTLVDLMENAAYLFVQRPIPMAEKAAGQIDAAARNTMQEILSELESIDDWTSVSLEDVLKSFVDKNELKFGQIAMPIRAALTGQAASPGVYDVMLALGKEESLGRLRDQL